MSTVLVTGGAGFIGSHTSVELLNAGYDIIILDNFVNSKPESLKRIKELTGKDFKFYQADIRDEEAMTKVFRREQDRCGYSLRGSQERSAERQRAAQLL